MRKFLLFILAGLAALSFLAFLKKPSSVYHNRPEDQNPLEGIKVRFIPDETDPVNADGIRGHLEPAGDSSYRPGLYERYVKRLFDTVFSSLLLLLLSPLFLILAAAIALDDPGPVLFTQKRIGRNKQFFLFHKFRSMRMSVPHDVPTHMLKDPERYMTRVGRFMRRYSLDELPQLWDILLGNMSFVGPRPALWNQDFLTAERDRWHANEVRPGLTGLAQTHGRNELSINEKARLDGVYVKNIGPGMDLSCLFGTLRAFKEKTV